MPISFQLFLTIILFSGFYLTGKIIVRFLNLKKALLFVSQPFYQYAVIGISIFLFLIYPLFFLEIFTKNIFQFFAIFFLILGFYQIANNYKLIFSRLSKEYLNFKSLDIVGKLTLILIFLYFLISLCPPTSGDTVAYHLSVSKYILYKGIFPSNFFDFEAKLAGSGELLNAFALSIQAYQFTSFIHFIGLCSIFGVLTKFCEENKLDNKKFFLFLLILSSPLLIFLISTSKPQFFYVSLVILSYAYLFRLSKKIPNRYIFKIYIFCNIILLTAVTAKISFSLSFFIFNFFYFFIIYKKNLFLKSLLALILFSSFSLLPAALWKSELYNYPFYNFLFNPLPLNIEGYKDYYLYLKNYESEYFPLLFLIPISFGTFTTTLGFGCLSLFFLITNDYKDKAKFIFLLILFSSIFLIFGQKSPRFFIELYILLVIILSRIIDKIYINNYFKILKTLVIFQSILVILSLSWGVINIFPGNINSKLNERVLTKYADGYSLYSWVNSVLPKNSSIIVDHRSTFFLQTINYLNTAALTSIEYENKKGRNLFLKNIKKFKPEYILFHGYKKKYSYGDFDFTDCLSNIFASSKGVGNIVARNPFNIKKNKNYDAYIYKINYKKFPSCVKKNNYN